MQAVEEQTYVRSAEIIPAEINTDFHSIKDKKLYLAVKRAFDIFSAICGIILLSPIMLLIAVLIKCEDGGPVIYTRICRGKNRSTYKMYKFRSMVVDADDLTQWLDYEQLQRYLDECKLDDDPRITRLGRFLRRTSLDELPQLFCVLNGDMSLIGPRPVVAQESLAYGEDIELLLSVKPGITGYWQVNGRSCVTYESGERQQMQLYYVENCSIALDIKIIFKTVAAILRGTGAK